MHLPLGESSIRSQEPLPDSKEGRAIGSEEVKGLRETTEDLVERQKAKLDAQRDEIIRLRSWKERYAKKYREAKERIAELEHHIGEVSEAHQETLEKQDQRVQSMADRLAQTEQLLATRSAELAGAQYFLSTTDRLSEADVLGIVRELNENVFQLAANLTEEWEKLGSSRSSKFTITQDDIDALSGFYGPALIDSVLDRNPAGITFLLQSCLCNIVAQIASRWRHDQEVSMLESVYQRLSASEGQAISARWRSLTHSHLSQPPPRSTLIAQHIADILYITGTFSSPQRSSDFAKAVALSGIETIDRLAMRLELAFMVEVASSDMSLVFEIPHTTFDNTRMVNEFGSNNGFTPGGRDKVAGTTEVGVGKSVGGGRGEGRHKEILLKAKVVLEKEVEEL